MLLKITTAYTAHQRSLGDLPYTQTGRRVIKTRRYSPYKLLFMKTLLRKIPDSQYLQFPGKWTTDPREALDFESMSRAVEFVEQAGYRNMELAFLFDNPCRLATVRVDTLEGLEQ